MGSTARSGRKFASLPSRTSDGAIRRRFDAYGTGCCRHLVACYHQTDWSYPAMIGIVAIWLALA